MLQQFNEVPPSNTPPQPSFIERNGYLVKASIILLLVLMMQIPIQMISGLITERQERQHKAASEVSADWGLEQVVTGPILTIPYYIAQYEDGKPLKKLAYATVLPTNLNIDGKMISKIRHRNVYEIVVYNSKTKFSGQFDFKDFSTLNIPAGDIVWANATLNMGISDLRGIEETIKVKWDNLETEFASGIEAKGVLPSGVHAAVSINPQNSSAFEFNLSLKGTSKLHFTPVGAETKIKLNSNWEHPSFSGAYLPAAHEIKEGFKADWKVSYLNRKYPQMWLGDAYAQALAQSAFGVNLFLSGDHYAKSERTVKYSFLLISLTFLAFFFMEVLNKQKVHPFQYILIGLALCIFYSLLISFAEYLAYDVAYLVAAVMTISLIGFYTTGIFKDKKYGTGIMGILSFLYIFVFVVIRLEAHSLLMGSVGLFTALATVMYLSRHVDWYHLKTEESL
jgi:inner membrane protein